MTTIVSTTTDTSIARSAPDLEYADAREALADSRVAARDLERSELCLLARAFGHDPEQDAVLRHATEECDTARLCASSGGIAFDNARGDAEWSRIADMLAGSSAA